jgi:hypothetical protein
VPVTFPSHAAAVLPLHHAFRDRLWLLPLIAGSCAPDVAYAFWAGGAFSHSPLGVLTFCLPVGLLLYVWLAALVLPALQLALPKVGRFEPARFLSTRGLPQVRSQWVWAAVAVLLGTLTHVLWDGLTHRLHEPAESLYGAVKVSLFGHQVHLTGVLQLVSSLGGALVTLVYAWRRYPNLPRVEPGRASRLVPILLASALAGAITFANEVHDILSGGLHWALWLGFWMTVRGAIWGLTAGCAIVVFSARRAASAGGAGT